MSPDTMLQNALPDLASDVRVEGLDAEVEIVRDAYGIPHIRAASHLDAFFGQGFVAAQDRLWQMEVDRRRAAGRWAEVVGPPGVQDDSFMRRAGLARCARLDYEAFSDATREVVDAYARGVNAFLATSKRLPVEFALTGVRPEPWEPWQCVAVYKVRHVYMGPLYRKLWRAALLREHGPELLSQMRADSSDGELLVVPPGEAYRAAVSDAAHLATNVEALAQIPDAEGASNSWALHGSRTASGKPLVAGDPHRALDMPNTYYQNQLSCPRFDAIGLSFAGVPGFPHFGHNASVAWCITHAMADDLDLFVERFDNGAPPVEQWTESIAVRDAEPLEVAAARTERGGVVLGGPDQGVGISLCWTATAARDTTFEALLPMLDADSVASFSEAMRPWVIPGNNLIVADVAGSIRYRFRGRLPIRSAANAWTPVPGWTGEHDWRGWVPFEDLPEATDPDGGCLVTANNRIAGDGAPYISIDFDGPNRARRILERLQPLEAATVEDMQSIHADDVSAVAPLFVRALAGLEPRDGEARAALERLREWDASMNVDSVAATIYAAFREQLTLRVAESGRLHGEGLGRLGAGARPLERSMFLWYAIPGLLTQRRDDLLAESDDWDALVETAFARALASLRERLGPDMDGWKWGRVHLTLCFHQLSLDFPPAREVLTAPRLPIGGDNDTVRCGIVIPGYGLLSAGASVARYAFDLADWERSGWVVPHGISGHPGSVHHSDQLEPWANVDLVPMHYSRAAVDAAAKTRQRLLPRT